VFPKRVILSPTSSSLFNVQVILAVLDEEAVLEELCRTSPAAELRLQRLRHRRPVAKVIKNFTDVSYDFSHDIAISVTVL
jgi:hypothetical protein